MRKLFIFKILSLLFLHELAAQVYQNGYNQSEISNKNEKIISVDATGPFSLFNFISPGLEEKKFKTDFNVPPVLLEIDAAKLIYMNEAKPDFLELAIPVSDSSQIILTLRKVNILSPDFSVTTGNGRTISYQPGLYYQGKIKGVEKSLAAISIFNDRFMGVFSDNDGNHVLSLRNERIVNKSYVLYNDKNILAYPGFTCGTEDTYVKVHNEVKKGNAYKRISDPCPVKIYFECDYQMYLDKEGSANNVANYVTGIFNVVQALFAKESIITEISEIYVWETPDPYLNYSKSADILPFFKNLRNPFNGDFAHLLSTRVIGAGGRAYLNGFCNPTWAYAYSNISNTYKPNLPPAYSWTTYVITHEQGHNFGSPHTHACVWNGNNTAIDGCGPVYGANANPPVTYEGNCSDAPIPPAGGTIMSYCHLGAAGINFNLGFGIQPGDLIRSNYFNAANCLSSCNSAPPNDNCSEAIQLTVGTNCNSTEGNIANATQSYPANGCPSGLIQDVWYRFTATSTGTYAVILGISGDMNGIVEVREGSCTGTVLRCVRGENGAIEIMHIQVTNGTTYYARVYEYNSPNDITPPVTTNFNICVIQWNDNAANPCDNITPIKGCGPSNSQTFTGGGTGVWFTDTENACGYKSPGSEKIYSFVPPITGNYRIEVSEASGYVDYLWKSGSCNSNGWNCYANISSTGAPGIMQWTEGTTYYILLDDEDMASGTHKFYITVDPSVSIAFTEGSNPICAGQSVTFTATPIYGGDNPSYQWKVNGNNVGTNSPTFTSSSLTNGDVVRCLLSSSTPCTGESVVNSNSITINVSSTISPSLSIKANASNMICEGTNVIFTATPVNGGNNPAYQWKLNGNNVGGNSNTYNNNTLANGDVISCVMTSSAQNNCTPTATSNNITMSVNRTVIPTITISASQNNICAGATVVFTAIETNGAYPSTQWKINGVNVTGNGYLTYTSSTLADGDVVTCVMTSAEPCANPKTVTSNSIVMKVNPTLAPSVSIAINNEGPICEGSTITFTATPANAGNNPAYQWKLNGTNVGDNSSTYSNNSLSIGDAISCVITSSAQNNCNPTATSNRIFVHFDQTVIPSVSISASETNICAGATVVFTATVTNGAYPTLQWKINGVDVEGNGYLKYTSSTLADGDVVSCEMTSDLPCANPRKATSNSIVMKVNATLAPSVSIAINREGPICEGSTITFTATPANAGNNPAYQWRLNGTNIGDNSSTYSNNSLGIGDAISCVITSSAQNNCNPTATSNRIYVHFDQTVIPSVSISASETNICAGTNVTFIAYPVEGNEPDIKWKLNGNDVNRNSSSRYVYNTSTLADGDVVSCEMISGYPCANPKTVTSNSIVMKVNASVTPSITINASQNNICAGTNVTFTASPINGADPYLRWKVNGNEVQIGSLTYHSNTLADGDVVSCFMISEHPCASPKSSVSNNIVMKVNTGTAPSINISSSHNNICAGTMVTFTASAINAGTNPKYQWKVGNTNVGINSPTFTTTSLTNGAVVTCVLTSTSACASNGTVTSPGIAISVSSPPLATIVAGGLLTFCLGKSVPLRVSTGTGYNYQWRRSGVNIPGETSSNFTANATGIYSGVVTNAAGCSTTSLALNVTVNPVPLASVVASGPLSFCSGKSVILRVGTGTGNTYQWKKGAANIDGATQSSYTATSSGLYTVVVTNASGCIVTSATSTVVVNPLPAATITPGGPLTFCSGKNALLRANTGTGFTYQWKRAGVNIPGETSLYYTAATTGFYNVVVTNAAGCATMSAATAVVVNPLPVAVITPAGPTTFCNGKNVVLRANTGTNYTYQWKKAGVNITVNGNSANYTASASGVYSVVVTNSYGCSVTSEPKTVTVNNAPVASLVPAGPTTFCANKDVLLKATAGAVYTYKWKRSGVVQNGTTSTYLAKEAGIYTVEVTNSSGCTVITNGIPVTVTPAPLATVAIAGPTTFCQGSKVLMKAIVGAGYTHQWRKDGVNQHNQINSSYEATSTGVYTVVVTNAQGCSTISTGIPVTVNPAPDAIITANGPLTFPQGGNVILKASAGNGYTYQWKKNGAILIGITSDSYTANATGSYTVDITNSDGCKTTSKSVQVSVTSGRLITKGLNDDGDLIKVYPNPLYRDEYLNIEWNQINADNGLQVKVSDITGRLIETRQLKPYDKKIRIKGASGVYIVEIRWGKNERKIFQVIKIE